MRTVKHTAGAPRAPRSPRRPPAALDALDRGVIDAGRTAAEAIARAEALEARCELLETRIRALFGVMAEANRVMGVTHSGPYEAAAAVQERRREIRLVTGGAS